MLYLFSGAGMLRNGCSKIVNVEKLSLSNPEARAPPYVEAGSQRPLLQGKMVAAE